MKLILLIFIIYLNYSLSQLTANGSKKVIVKTYPKKVKQGFLLFNNAGKYVKSTVQKKTGRRNYTVFPNKFAPESPYFATEVSPGETKRIKKNLPEYVPLMRYKRSTDDKKEGVKKLKAPTKLSKTNEAAIKKSKAPVKANERTAGQAKKLKAIKTRQSKRVGKKKRDLSNNTFSKRNKQKRGERLQSQKLKRSPSGNQQLKQKISQSRSDRVRGRSKKPVGNKKLKNPDYVAQERLKYSAIRKQKASNMGPQKKLSQASRNRNSKNRARKGSSARRLIAARDALIEEYPYVVSIQKDKKHWCSGALLNPTLVITTANCLWRSRSISRMRVRAGSRHTDRDGQVARIQEVMKHPGWKIRRHPDNDIALVLLDRRIRFSHSIHGVDLPNRVMWPPFDDAWVTSWGSDRRDGIFDTGGMTLQVYHARLMEHDKCNNVTMRFGVAVTENFICLAQTGRRAPCTRDTGAPAVSDGVIWGLASWGIRKLCGTERFPAMFSYTASQSNMDFILNASHYLMADERFYPFPDRFPMKKVILNENSHTNLTIPH